MDGQWRRNTAENFNRLIIGRTKVTGDKQTDRQTKRQDIANVNVSSRSLKINFSGTYMSR